MALLVAMLTAAGFAVFGFPFRYYQCWMSWSRVGAHLGILVYMVIAGSGGGLIGLLAAKLANVEPPFGEHVDGFLCGAAGALAIRADFRSQRPGPAWQSQQAASLLGKGITWSTTMLDDITRRRAKSWLASLDDDALLLVAVDIVAELEGKPVKEVSAAAKRTTMGRIVDAMRDLRSASDGDEQRYDARARLVNFSTVYFAAYHVPKPTLGRALPVAERHQPVRR